MDIRTKFAETLIELGELEQAKDRASELILESPTRRSSERGSGWGSCFIVSGTTRLAVDEWKQCLEDDPAGHAGAGVPGFGGDVLATAVTGSG